MKVGVENQHFIGKLTFYLANKYFITLQSLANSNFLKFTELEHDNGGHKNDHDGCVHDDS